MHYLNTSLSGEAAQLISNLSVSEENFAFAWKNLTARYENKRFIVYSQLDKLYNMKSVKSSSARSFSTFSTIATECLTSLRAQRCPVQQWETIIVYLLIRLLDTESRKDWELQLGLSPNLPTLIQFEKFMTERARALENLERHQGNLKENTYPLTSRSNHPIKLHVTATSNTSNISLCFLCKRLHYLASCPIFAAKTSQQQRDYIATQKLCFNCLGYHSVGTCFSKEKCFRCGKKHHTSLHLEMRKEFTTAKKENSASQTRDEQSSEEHI